MGHRGQGPQQGQAHRRRSAFHALRIGRRLLRTDPARDRHHFLGRPDQLPADPNDKIQRDYVLNYTDLPFIVKEEFTFTDGIYSGYDADKHSYDKSSWDYEIGTDGYAKVDPTLQHPRCVYNLLKQHYARYVPEMVERVCGTPKDRVLHI